MTPDRVSLPQFTSLTWRDVDPARRPAVDPAAVAALVRGLPQVAEMPPAGSDRRLTDFWYDRMTEGLVEHLGPWAAAWHHTVTMEDYRDFGVVPLWRTDRPPVTTPEETLTRLTGAVLAWHELLEEIATDARGRFTGGAAPAAGEDDDPPAWRVVKGSTMYFDNRSQPRGLPLPWRLNWADVDPAGRETDVTTVPDVVAALVAAAPMPSRDADWRLREHWLDTVTTGLIDRYGRWVVGWRWSNGEGDLDGGPVGTWCCYPHSATTPEATAAVIAAAVLEWHEWLADLAERFGRFLPLSAGDLDGWERAVAHLVTAVGDRTQYDSGWYGCCETALGWFLDAAGIAPDRHAELIGHAIGGRFASWTEPSRQVVDTVAARLAERVADDRK